MFKFSLQALVKPKLNLTNELLLSNELCAQDIKHECNDYVRVFKETHKNINNINEILTYIKNNGETEVVQQLFGSVVSIEAGAQTLPKKIITKIDKWFTKITEYNTGTLQTTVNAVLRYINEAINKKTELELSETNNEKAISIVSSQTMLTTIIAFINKEIDVLGKLSSKAAGSSANSIETLLDGITKERDKYQKSVASLRDEGKMQTINQGGWTDLNKLKKLKESIEPINETISRLVSTKEKVDEIIKKFTSATTPNTDDNPTQQRIIGYIKEEALVDISDAISDIVTILSTVGKIVKTFK